MVPKIYAIIHYEFITTVNIRKYKKNYAAFAALLSVGQFSNEKTLNRGNFWKIFV